jgi:hypothetical protein
VCKCLGVCGWLAGVGGGASCFLATYCGRGLRHHALCVPPKGLRGMPGVWPCSSAHQCCAASFLDNRGGMFCAVSELTAGVYVLCML